MAVQIERKEQAKHSEWSFYYLYTMYIRENEITDLQIFLQYPLRVASTEDVTVNIVTPIFSSFTDLLD